MSLKFRREALSSAEAGLLAWQFGVSEEDNAFMTALWVAIARALEHGVRGNTDAQAFIERLTVAGAFGDEVTVYRHFMGPDGEAYWLDILKRAGLGDRRQRSQEAPVERRKVRQAS